MRIKSANSEFIAKFKSVIQYQKNILKNDQNHSEIKLIGLHGKRKPSRTIKIPKTEKLTEKLQKNNMNYQHPSLIKWREIVIEHFIGVDLEEFSKMKFANVQDKAYMMYFEEL